jgi:hypothetical protein
MPSEDQHRELIERFDAHLERSDRALERMDARMARNDDVLERNAQAFERNTQAFERNTKAWGHTVAVFTAVLKSIEDMRDEIRAQTQAIYRVIDRLDEGRSGA